MMSRTSTQIIGVDHFTRFTKPSYVALAAFMSFAEAMFHPQKLRARQALPDCSSVHTLQAQDCNSLFALNRLFTLFVYSLAPVRSVGGVNRANHAGA